MLFPLPIQIPAYAVAGVILLLNFVTQNTAGFGGIGAAYLMTNVI